MMEAGKILLITILGPQAILSRLRTSIGSVWLATTVFERLHTSSKYAGFLQILLPMLHVPSAPASFSTTTEAAFIKHRQPMGDHYVKLMA